MFLNIQFSPVRVLLVSGLIAASDSLASAAGQASRATNYPAVEKAQFVQDYGNLSLSFEPNHGQADTTVKFLSSGSGYSLFLTDSSLVLALAKQNASPAKPGSAIGRQPASAGPARKMDIVRMDLVGANHAMQITGMGRLSGTANYFLGNDPATWLSGLPTYAKVEYGNAYPGINLIYHGNQRQLEYDFIVAPGADPNPIRLQFVGAKKLELTADGDLIVSAENGEIAFHKPVVYQVKDGERLPIVGKFALLAKSTIGFTLGPFDPSRSLVIDPVLAYSTYLGGSLSDGANGVAVDSSGNAYVVGSTFSTNFPVTTGAVQPTNKEPASFQCIIVTKLNPTGTALVYSTYLGGSGNPGNNAQFGDVGQAIAVDGSGDAYVTGFTQSTSFPITPSAYQAVNNSTPGGYIENAFVTKLNPTGTALVYSTYLGGAEQDSASAIAVDSSDYAYVIGTTTSANFPTTSGAFQVINHASPSWGNAFVTKLNPTGTALVYSTYLGGSSFGAKGAGITVDGSGDAYLTGSAASQDFPITNGAFQNTNTAVAASGGPDSVVYNVFVTKLNSNGSGLVYSTFLGGSIDDYGYGIALDGSGDAYVTGQSWSSDFPVAGGAFQPTNNAYANDAPSAFVTKVNPAGTGLVYSTFLGGSGLPPNPALQTQNSSSSGSGDTGQAIAVDSLGDAYVTGGAISSNFPTTSDAFQTVNNAASSVQPIGVNAFVTELNPAGSALLYSTYLGGSVQDQGIGIALDRVGGVYVAGQTSSTNFPVTSGVLQPAFAGGDSDAFIAKIALSASMSGPTPTPTPTPTPPGGGGGSGGSNGSARLINISTRAEVGTGANILIPGFVISGSGTETLLIRADGPGLTEFGVGGVLALPSLSVFNSSGTVIATNTGWGTNANPALIASTAASVGAFALTSGSADCALIASLPAGAYTVQVSGVNNTSGVALAEVYEVSSSGTRLVNISTRAQVGTGANIIIPGFVISGSGTEQLLVRADGPALAEFGVGGVLAEPSLSVFNNSGTVIATNAGWGTSANPALIASTAAAVGAFAFTSGSADSAEIVNLSPGAYTIQVSGVGNSTGVALAEVYEVP